MFIEIDTKYFAFGAKYSFDIKIRRCYETSLQKVESLLICEGPSGKYQKYFTNVVFVNNFITGINMGGSRSWYIIFNTKSN